MRVPSLMSWRPVFGWIAALALGVTILSALPRRGGAAVPEFTPPGREARLAALGPLDALTPAARRIYADETGFSPIPKPKANDWLANHREDGQTFAEFLTQDRNRPDAKRKVIYLQPLGAIPAEVTPVLERLRAFSQIYFGLETRLGEARGLETFRITRRVNAHTGKPQLLAGDLLDVLRRKLPADAFCLLGVTCDDLYPDPAWNFVFGMASLTERVGVYSLARYDEAFWGAQRPADHATVLLRRTFKVMAHETGHMFGIEHDTVYHCLMNGSNHLGETDAAPLHLGPLSLRKLQQAVGFDPIARYRALEAVYLEAGLTVEADWVEARLKVLAGG